MKTLILLLILVLIPAGQAKASDAIDYSQLQEEIDDSADIDFKSTVNDIMDGKLKLSIKSIFNWIIEKTDIENIINVKDYVSIILVITISTIFTNLASAFKTGQASEAAFYCTYIILCVLIANVYYISSEYAQEMIKKVLDVSKLLIPAYSMAMVLSTGSVTAALYYESTLTMLALIELILLKVLLPAVNLYMITSVASSMQKEETFSKLAELIEEIIRAILKLILAAVIGFGCLQNMIAPITDNLKRSALLNTIKAIPAFGSVINGATETILGTGILLKNSIGIAGLLTIVAISVIPIFKLAISMLLYKFSSAVLQPISDKRIISCMNSCSTAMQLLIKIIFILVLSMFISLTIISYSTLNI